MSQEQTSRDPRLLKSDPVMWHQTWFLCQWIHWQLCVSASAVPLCVCVCVVGVASLSPYTPAPGRSPATHPAISSAVYLLRFFTPSSPDCWSPSAVLLTPAPSGFSRGFFLLFVNCALHRSRLELSVTVSPPDLMYEQFILISFAVILLCSAVGYLSSVQIAEQSGWSCALNVKSLKQVTCVLSWWLRSA